MDDSIKIPEIKPQREPIGWRCTADGKHFATFPAKRCKYCVPVYAEQPDTVREG